jgi:pyruvate formate-lyase activating enzyme-like uncharacterized protein
MKRRNPAPVSETFERYAVGLARNETLPVEESSALLNSRRERLLAELRDLGVQGWPERKTYYTRTLPNGCVLCLAGRGSNLCLTTRCNRDCFFCFNPKPRADGISVHGRKVDDLDEAPQILSQFGISSVGLSGGEPLLDPGQVMDTARILRSKMGPDLRIDLYTNGDFLTTELAKQLKSSGINALRINLAASGYKIRAVEVALEVFDEVEVEIPAIPTHVARLRRLMEDLERIGAPHLILHELFCSAQNIDRMRQLGLKGKDEKAAETLTWRAVSGSEETALDLMLYALKRATKLSVYYCSCGTQEWIAEQALSNRQAS